MNLKQYTFLINLFSNTENKLDPNTLKSNFSYFFQESWEQIPLENKREDKEGKKDREEREEREKLKLFNKIKTRIDNLSKENETLKVNKGFNWRKAKILFSSIAASIVIILGITFLFNKTTKIHYLEITAENNLEVNLPDSSSVLLFKGAHIKYASDFTKERSVILNGDAMFKIRKKTDKKFQVKLASSQITVKGTTFIIKQDKKNNANISLIEGCIEFKSLNNVINMKPNDHLAYNAELEKCKITNLAHMKWENQRMYFKDINLQELIKTINTIYNTTLSISPRIKTNPLFTGSIDYYESIDEIISKLCFTMNIKYDSSKQEFI